MSSALKTINRGPNMRQSKKLIEVAQPVDAISENSRTLNFYEHGFVD